MPSWDFEFIVTLEAPTRSTAHPNERARQAQSLYRLPMWARCIIHVPGAHLLVVLSSTTVLHLQATSTTPASGGFILNHLPLAILPHQRRMARINTVEADFAQSLLQQLFAGVRAFTHSESPHPVEAYTHWDFSPLEV